MEDTETEFRTIVDLSLPKNAWRLDLRPGQRAEVRVGDMMYRDDRPDAGRVENADFVTAVVVRSNAKFLALQTCDHVAWTRSLVITRRSSRDLAQAGSYRPKHGTELQGSLPSEGSDFPLVHTDVSHLAGGVISGCRQVGLDWRFGLGATGPQSVSCVKASSGGTGKRDCMDETPPLAIQLTSQTRAALLDRTRGCIHALQCCCGRLDTAVVGRTRRLEGLQGSAHVVTGLRQPS